MENADAIFRVPHIGASDVVGSETMPSPTVVFWDGLPTERASAIIAIRRADFTGGLMERLSKMRSRREFRRLACEIGSAGWEATSIEAATLSPDTFHLVFFRGSVQVSFGERGFVPLDRLLDYHPGELRTYMAEPSRIALMRRLHAGHCGSVAVH